MTPIRTGETEGTTGAQAVARSIAVLRSVAALTPASASLAAVVRMTGLNRTTAFRLLQCLVDERMLAFDSVTKIYCVGPLATELGLAGGGFQHIAAPWRDAIQRISHRCSLTAYLVVRTGSEVVCLESVQAQTPLRAVPLVPGQRLPLGIGAGSLAILSSLDDDDVAAILDDNKTQRAAQVSPQLTRDELLHRVARTRETGFAYSSQSVALGIVGLGVAIPRGDGLVQLAASVSKAAEAMDVSEQERLAQIIREELGLAHSADRSAA